MNRYISKKNACFTIALLLTIFCCVLRSQAEQDDLQSEETVIDFSLISEEDSAGEDFSEEPSAISQEDASEELQPVFPELIYDDELPEDLLSEEGSSEEVLAEDIPAEEMPAEGIPAEEIPAEEMMTEDMPGADMPAEETAEENSADELFSETSQENAAEWMSQEDDEEIPGVPTGFEREEWSDEASIGDAASAWRSEESSIRLFSAKKSLGYQVTAEYYGNQIYSNEFSARVYRVMQQGNWSAGTGSYRVSITMITENSMDTHTYAKEEQIYAQTKEQVYAGASAAVDAFVYDYPKEAFWIRNYRTGIAYRGYYHEKEHKYYASVTISVDALERWSGAFRQTDELEQKIRSSLAAIRSDGYESLTTGEKIKKVHDYICTLAVYGNSTLDDVIQLEHTPLGAYKNGGKIVCEGYAKLFKILMDRLGLCNTVLLSGEGYVTLDDHDSHMWNAVCLNDVWYLADLTWDDIEGETYYNYFLAGTESKGFPWEDGNGSWTWMTAGEQHETANHWSSQTRAFKTPAISTAMYHQEKILTLDGSEDSAQNSENDSSENVTVICGLHPKLVLEPEMAEKDVPEEDALAAMAALEEEKSRREEKEKTAAAQRQLQEEKREKEQSRLMGLYEQAKDLEENSYTQLIKSEFPASSGSVFKLNVKNGKSVPLQAGKKSKKIKVVKIPKGDSLAKASSSNKKIVKVSVKGSTVILKGQKKTGSAKITVRTKKGYTCRFKVKVQKDRVKTKKISVAKKTLKIRKGERASIAAKLLPVTSPDKIRYKSGSKKTAKVSKKGIVTGRKKGKTWIRVTAGKIKVKVVVVVSG